jgi:hypothetical protein
MGTPSSSNSRQGNIDCSSSSRRHQTPLLSQATWTPPPLLVLLLLLLRLLLLRLRLMSLWLTHHLQQQPLPNRCSYQLQQQKHSLKASPLGHTSRRRRRSSSSSREVLHSQVLLDLKHPQQLPTVQCKHQHQQQQQVELHLR